MELPGSASRMAEARQFRAIIAQQDVNLVIGSVGHAIGFETGVELHIVLQCLKELHQRIGRTITAHLGMRLLILKSSVTLA